MERTLKFELPEGYENDSEWVALTEVIWDLYVTFFDPKGSVVKPPERNLFVQNLSGFQMGKGEITYLQSSMGFGDYYDKYYGLPKILEPIKEQYKYCLNKLFPRFNETDGLWVYNEYIPSAVFHPDDIQDATVLALTLPHFRLFGEEYKFRTVKEFRGNRRTVFSVSTPGRYLTRILGVNSQRCAQRLSNYVENFLNTIEMQVLFKENNDLKGWEKVYMDQNVHSCMNSGDEYGVADLETYQCYCTSAHGLPDNGLRLAYVLGSHGNLVGRAIVHEPSKSYVKTYTDGNELTHTEFQGMLDSLGYCRQAGMPDGVTLWTEYVWDYTDSGGYEHSGYIHPYVDGNNVCASISHEVIDRDRVYYWVIDSDVHGVPLNCADGVLDFQGRS